MQTTDLRILADTEVHPTDDNEAYSRTIILNGWDKYDNQRLARIDIKVHRVPGNSIAQGLVWSERGWIEVLTLPNVTFWSGMPGYTRWKQDNAESTTRLLAFDVADRMAEVADSGSLF